MENIVQVYSSPCWLYPKLSNSFLHPCSSWWGFLPSDISLFQSIPSIIALKTLVAFTACQMESQVPQGLSPVDLSSAPDASPRLSCVVLDDTQAAHLLFPGQTDKFLISDYYFPEFSFPKSPPIKKPTNSSRPISNVTSVKNSSLIPTPYSLHSLNSYGIL